MDVSVVGVVGAGFMGSGIVETSSAAGKRVLLFEPSEAPLEHSRRMLAAALERAVGRERITREDADAQAARVTYTTRFEDLAEAEAVIEAISRGRAGEGRAVQAARRRASGRALPGLQHVVDPDRRAGGMDRASRARARTALLLAGSGDEAGRGRRRARDLRRDGQHGRGVRAGDRQARDSHQGSLRVHRQHAAGPVSDGGACACTRRASPTARTSMRA